MSLDGKTGSNYSPAWSEGLTYLELNSTNLCNLACLHCTGAFSTRWLQDEKRLREDGYRFEGHGTGDHDGSRYQTHEVNLPDSELLFQNISDMDLSMLAFVNLKGGEPMLNSDVKTLLGFLRSKGILPQVKIHLSTNATLVDSEILDHLASAACVRVWLSVVGVGRLQEYIRYGESSIHVIERTISEYGKLTHIELGLCTSVMPYNVFSLDKIYGWWSALPGAYPSVRFLDAEFNLMVTVPSYLSIRCLKDATRKKLIAFYERRNVRMHGSKIATWTHRLFQKAGALLMGSYKGYKLPGPYSHVIAMLEQPYLGDAVHRRFVEYTFAMDRYRGTNVLDVVPELKDELVGRAP